MEHTIPNLESISRKLTSLERPKKTKMLVVDDEPDNLDLLYRTFRRDFQVLKAESGVKALEVLAQEGEVAVIISDQRMPEMKGTEFLSRTVPEFPDTVRIILTGFTDVEDLVDAINSGQVYKYITKPWDPEELKAVVHRAAETYELLKQRTEELRQSEAQMALMATIVQVVQEATSLDSTLDPLARSFCRSFSADGAILQLLIGTQLSNVQGSYGCDSSGPDRAVINWLAEDDGVKAAIASGQIQVATHILADPKLESRVYYAEHGVQTHVVVPVILRGESLAVLSLQWHHPATLRPDELRLLHLAAQQVALALTCNRYVGELTIA